MTELVLILAYVLSIFLNRFLTYIEYRMDNGRRGVLGYKHPSLWFIPIIGTLFCIIGIAVTYFDYHVSNGKTWFTGKNW